jgi:hypothetical protein
MAIVAGSVFKYRFAVYGLFLIYFINRLRTRNMRTLYHAFVYDVSRTLKVIVVIISAALVLVSLGVIIKTNG